jgi:hypothetical protein
VETQTKLVTNKHIQGKNIIFEQINMHINNKHSILRFIKNKNNANKQFLEESCEQITKENKNIAYYAPP